MKNILGFVEVENIDNEQIYIEAQKKNPKIINSKTVIDSKKKNV